MKREGRERSTVVRTLKSILGFSEASSKILSRASTEPKSKNREDSQLTILLIEHRHTGAGHSDASETQTQSEADFQTSKKHTRVSVDATGLKNKKELTMRSYAEEGDSGGDADILRSTDYGGLHRLLSKSAKAQRNDSNVGELPKSTRMIQLPTQDERQSIAFAVPKKSGMSDSQPLTRASHLTIVTLICILHIQELINQACARRHLVPPNAKCHNSSCTTLAPNRVNKSFRNIPF